LSFANAYYDEAGREGGGEWISKEFWSCGSSIENEAV